MAGMNMLAAQGAYAFGASAASGVSIVALSYALPNGIRSVVGGSIVLCVQNTHTTDPVHAQVRSVWTDMYGVSQTVHLGLALSGTSAHVTAQTLLWVGSNHGVAVPYTNIVGSALQVVILNAVSGTGVGASGTVSIWGL